MTDKKRYDDLRPQEKNHLIADIIEFFEDDGSMNGKLMKDLIEAFPEYDEKDLNQLRKALVDVRAVYQDRPYRDALYIALRAGLKYARILREE